MKESITPKMCELDAKEKIANILINSKFPASSFDFKNCCVGLVDIVGSTKLSAKLSTSQICPFYCLFISQMTSLIEESGGTVIKNGGDSLLFYFPKTSDISNRSSLLEALDCGIKIIDYHRILNSLMHEVRLPKVDYRVSLDYGEIGITKLENSSDIFGPTINLCAKMNKMAEPNTLVIGGDLQLILKSEEDLKFEPRSDFHNGLKLQYPIYTVIPDQI